MKTIQPHRGAFGMALIVSLLGASCAEEFTPMNELEGLRVLAIQSDPPAIGTGQTAQLAALVHAPEGQTVNYSWSWCPFLGSAQSGYECMIDEAQLKEALQAIDPSAVALVPSFDLGTEPTATFTLRLPTPLLDLLCETVLGQATASLGITPTCGDTVKSSVVLKISSGQESVTATKSLGLLLEASGASTNPPIGSVKARWKKGDDWFVLGEEESASVESGKTYVVDVDVEEEASEWFTPPATDAEPNPEPRRERLFITWFVTAGSTESIRTGFIDGKVGFDVLRSNSWAIPQIDPPSEATLYVVLQDERGGVTWTQRTVKVQE
jgi:hypothetical protein